MTKITKLSELFKALEDGERVEFKGSRGWMDSKLKLPDFEIGIGDVLMYVEHGLYRIAPKMTYIEGPGGRFEYPEPEQACITDKRAFVVMPHMKSEGMVCRMRFDDENIDDLHMLKSGLIHLTEEAAKQHSEAIIKAQGGEV